MELTHDPTPLVKAHLIPIPPLERELESISESSKEGEKTDQLLISEVRLTGVQTPPTMLNPT